MRSSSRTEHPKRPAHRLTQRLHFVAIKRSSGSGRVKTRSPQQFISEKVAETSETGLVHESSLEWRFTTCQQRSELTKSHLGRIRPETILIGIKFDPSESSRVAHS
jgi:hypothetical protein